MHLVPVDSSVGVRNTVKYVYCIIDEIAGGVDRMGDSPDTGLLPLLGRIEGTFTYRHYQLTQALDETHMSGFTTWCLHRLILISCRPVFGYHLNAVSVVMKKLLLVLERHHLNLFIEKSLVLLTLLSDLLHALDRFDQNEKVEGLDFTINCFTLLDTQQLIPGNDKDDGVTLQTNPIHLLNVRSAYHLTTVLCQTLSTIVVSFYTYAPTFVIKAFHTFGLAVELCDISSKHYALEALFHGATCILSTGIENRSTLSSTVLRLALDYVRNAVALAVSTLSDWFEGRLPLVADEIASSDFASLEQLIARCLCWLVTGNHGDAANKLPGSEYTLPHGDSENVLLSVARRLLSQAWIMLTDHTPIRCALLDYVASFHSVRIRSDESLHADNTPVTLKDGKLTCLFDGVNMIPELVNPFVLSSTLLDQLEVNETKIEAIVRQQLGHISTDKWKRFFAEFRLPSADSSSLSHLAPIWFRLGRLWGAFRVNLNDFVSIKDDMLDATIHAVKHIVLALPRPNKFPDTVQDCGNHAPLLVFAGIRFLAQCIATLPALSEGNVLGETLCLSLFNWLHEFSTLLSQDNAFSSSSPWRFLREPTLHLTCTLAMWCSTVTPTVTITADKISTVICPLTLSSFGVPDVNPRLNNVVQQLTPQTGTPESTEFLLSVSRKLLRDLIKLAHRIPLSKQTALFLAHLSSSVICTQTGCGKQASLYCRNHSQNMSSGSLEVPAITTIAAEPDLDMYTIAEQMEVLNLLLDVRHVELTYEAVVDLTVHLSHHISWTNATVAQVQDFLSLIQNELPHYTPPIIRAIYENMSCRLSVIDLNAWITVHSYAFNLLSTRPRQGPSSSLGCTLLDEYRILQYGALGCCLADHYADLLCLSPTLITGCNGYFVDRRNSSQGSMSGIRSSLSVSSGFVSDHLIPVVAALCRLGLTHQYTHALYGAVYIQLEEIIQALHMKPSHVLRLCREKIAQVVVEHTDQAVSQAVESLARLFRLEKTVIFKELISPLFITLVLRGNQESHLHIRQLVNEVPYINSSQDYVSKIIQLCVLPETLVHIFTRTSKEEQDVHLAFLESHLSMSIERIARLNDVSRLMHQFVLRLYPFRVGASQGLRWVASRVLTQRDPSGSTLSASGAKGPAAADFLGHYVCGILAFFDNTLLDDDTMLEHRWIALRSLVVFIQLLGSGHVTRMRAKFMATLKICLRYKTMPFANVVIKAWRSFIRTLEPDALCELLPDLGATLVSLLPYGSDQVTDLFNFLFLEKKDQLDERLACLFFLPRIPQLLTCQQILDDICAWRSFSTFGLTTLTETQLYPLLSAWLSALTHSSRSVRRLTLTSELATTCTGAEFTSSRLWGLPNQVYNLTVSSAASTATGTHTPDATDYLDGTTDAQQPRRSSTLLLADLISALLEGLTRDTDTQMRLLYAQWLGQLGAIDPSKLCPSVKCTTPGVRSTVYVNDRRFPFFILCELAKIYLRAASPKQLDSTALAIQELLKLFKVPENIRRNVLGKSSSSAHLDATATTSCSSITTTADSAALPFVSGSELWSLFPEHLCDLFAPLLTSRYAVEAFTDWTTVKSPLIATGDDLTFESWIRLWAGSLSAHITSQHAFQIFQFCEPVVKTDAGFARLLLEHAALQVLLDDAQAGIDQLQSEILAVLKEVSEAGHLEETETATSNELPTTSLGDDWNTMTGLPAVGGKQSRWKSWFPLAVQTVFGLLDHLRQWHREQRSLITPTSGKTHAATASHVSSNQSHPLHNAVKRVGAFLTSIPHLMQAQASLRCGGFARALLQWELAYDEDITAQQSAYNTGVALVRSSAVTRVTEFASPHTSTTNTTNNGDHSKSGTVAVGTVGLTALSGLMNTYACLRDSDGLAGVLAVSQLTTGAKPSTASSHLSPTTTNNHLTERFSALRALELENEGQLDMAAAQYEHNLAHWEFESTGPPGAQSVQDKRLTLYAGLFRCELSDPARLHGLVERAGALIRRHTVVDNTAPVSKVSQSGNPVWAQRLNAYRAEAAWRLSDWGTLRETTNLDPVASSWSVGMGKLFLAINDQRPNDWASILTKLRVGQMNELGAAALEGPGGYARAYDTIARLSALTDVELIAQLGELIRHQLTRPNRDRMAAPDNLLRDQSITHLKSRIDDVLAMLDARIKLAQPTFHTLEPCLALHHTALHSIWLDLQAVDRSTNSNSPVTDLVSRVRMALGQNWLQRAKLTRKSGQFMAAYTCVLRAEAFDVPEALLERAKLLWKTDKRDAAQACLDKGIPEIFGEVVSATVGSNRKTTKAQTESQLWSAAQQALLLRARYCEETSRFDFETTQRMYEEVCQMSDGCEEAHFRLARYVDRAQSLATNSKQYDTLLKAALKHYGLALSFGSQFIYQSMPRLLSLWLDYGTDYARHSVTLNSRTQIGGEHRVPADQKTFQEVQDIMRQNIERVPAYQYYTALSQLLSRVCHEVPTVVNTLIDLVVRIFEAYPHQTIWFLMPLNDSTIRQRRDRCQQVFNMVKARQPQLGKFIADSVALCNHLRTICSLFMTADRRELRNFSLRQTLRPLTRLIESSDFSRILVPIHRQLVPSLLPSRSRREDVQRHWPFGSGPDHLVYLTRMDDNVDILGSQTRPKKMTWLGSDGRRYIIVAKPNDDLRKDSRLMELNGMINKFLVKNPETRRRALQIRTYAVIPLSEKGGLIEWVSNTEPFRTIITRLYNEAGRPINWANMSRVAPLLEDPLPVKRDKYLNKWLPMFPLVFHRWFLETFPNPSAWYSARECYARTCAVMSMVGYVLGLGDRHTENILFDSTSGGVVHVDFSCVFNNGLTLPWPERVPFRLTRNMVRALGPTGYEGIFRRSAEAVMRLLRHEVDPFLAVFRPIYFDALVEQGGNARVIPPPATDNTAGRTRRGPTDATSASDLTERVARAATEKLTAMEDRLHGKITEHDGFSQILPMSAEGQVDALINEATDVNQLCQMYKGWMPFL